jgi:hypothetical protein
MRPLAVVLVAASIGFGADWSEIMRPEAPAPIPKAAVREPDETHPPAGKLIYRGGWWYEADGRGGDVFSEPLNGMTEAAALAWWHADQAKRKAARPANPTQPGWSPGQPTTRTTGVIGAAGPSTWSPGFYPAGSTFTPVRVGTRGGTSAGCVSGYG